MFEDKVRETGANESNADVISAFTRPQVAGVLFRYKLSMESCN
jgi:hypothetical protein